MQRRRIVSGAPGVHAQGDRFRTADGVADPEFRGAGEAAFDDGAGHANDGTIIDGTIIDVCLIPETLARTNLAERRVGDTINVEVDHLAKLVARQLEWMQARDAR